MTLKLKPKGWGGIRKDRRGGMCGLGGLQKVLETCQLVGLRELEQRMINRAIKRASSEIRETGENNIIKIFIA